MIPVLSFLKVLKDFKVLKTHLNPQMKERSKPSFTVENDMNLRYFQLRLPTQTLVFFVRDVRDCYGQCSMGKTTTFYGDRMPLITGFPLVASKLQVFVTF